MSSYPKASKFLVSIFLIALVLSIYWQVGSHSFINLDDDEYVYSNPQVKKGLTLSGLAWAVTATHAANWHPLTWVSHMADVQVFGMNAGWHHRVNLALHALNAVLLFLVIHQMTGMLWRGAFVATLFAAHPMHAESVAWLAERKDLLSALFWLLTTSAYVRYARQPGVGRYVWIVVFFALGLASKPMLVTLPFVLLLLDYWPLERLGTIGSAAPPRPSEGLPLSRLLLEKSPLFLMSGISCIVTYLAQQGRDAAASLTLLPLGTRVGNAAISYVWYLWKAVVPAGLAVYYPHPASIRVAIPAWQIAGAALILCIVSCLAIRLRRRYPWLVVGWAWYLGALVPVIGLVQVGYQARADRYAYLPLIGIFIMIAWSASEVSRKLAIKRQALFALAGALAVALSIATWNQLRYWRNSETLFTRALGVTEKNWMARYQLAKAHEEKGEHLQAYENVKAALSIRPDYAEAWTTLGAIYENLGQYEQAVEVCRKAVFLRPTHAEAWFNLGLVYAKAGKYAQATDALQKAIRRKPQYPEAWLNLGVAYARLGRYSESVETCREAVRQNPEDGAAWNVLGTAYGNSGQLAPALAAFKEAVRLNPEDADASLNLGVAYSGAGQTDQALQVLQRLRQMDPVRAGILARETARSK